MKALPNIPIFTIDNLNLENFKGYELKYNDYYLYFIHNMIYFNLLHRNNHTLNEVVLNIKVMSRLYGGYNIVKKLLNFLTIHEVIHKTENYIIGIHSNYYQFNKNHINNYSFEKYKITNLKLIKRINLVEKNKKKIIKERDKNLIKITKNNPEKIKEIKLKNSKIYNLKYQVSISSTDIY